MNRVASRFSGFSASTCVVLASSVPSPASAMMAGAPSCACAAGDFDADCTIGGADVGMLLAAWGVPGSSVDITGDGTVDGADLGALIANWGPCPVASACAGFESMSFLGEFVGGPGTGLPVVVLSGQLDVVDAGEPQGMLDAVLFDGSIVSVTFALGITTLYVDSSLVLLLPDDQLELAEVDGAVVAIPEMLGEFDAALHSDAVPRAWSVASRAVLVLAALAETQAFCCNLQAALDEGGSGYWGKTGVVSLAGCIIAEGVAGCEELTGGCDSSSTALVGMFAAPCELLEPLCSDDIFAGPQASFDAVQGLWLGM